MTFEEKVIEKLESYQKAYGKCFDLLEHEDLEQLASDLVESLGVEEKVKL